MSLSLPFFYFLLGLNGGSFACWSLQPDIYINILVRVRFYPSKVTSFLCIWGRTSVPLIFVFLCGEKVFFLGGQANKSQQEIPITSRMIRLYLGPLLELFIDLLFYMQQQRAFFFFFFRFYLSDAVLKPF